MKIRDFLEKPIFYLLLWSVVLASILSGFFVLAEWYASSPFGYGGFSVLLMATCLNFLLLFAFFGIPTSVVFLFIKKLRPYSLKLFFCSIIYIFVAFPIARLSNDIRSTAFSRLAAKPNYLVNAIDQYVNDNQKPPKS